LQKAVCEANPVHLPEKAWPAAPLRLQKALADGQDGKEEIGLL
jgi:hypothetical protein